jgi:NAD-dependent histone deacetylase SIR2
VLESVLVLVSIMDLVPAPEMEGSLKKPLVELDVADSVSADQEATVSPEGPSGATLEEEAPSSQDDSESSDSSGEDWEADSLYEEALHFVRDDQLSLGIREFPASHLSSLSGC